MRKTNLMFALGAAAIGALSMAPAARASLVAQWNLNEGSGTTTTESLSGTASADFSNLTPAPTWGAASPYAGSTASLVFGGTTQANQLDTNVSGASLAGSGSKTFVAWIKATGLSSFGAGILSYSPTRGSVPGGDLRMRLDTNGNLRAEVGGGDLVDSKGTDLVGAGWRMVAVVFNSNTSTSKLYVQGEGLVTQASIVDHAIDTAGTTSNGGTLDYVIGGVQVTGFGFKGNIDRVQVYNNALSASQLDALATAAPTPEPASLALLAIGGLLLVCRRRHVRQ